MSLYKKNILPATVEPLRRYVDVLCLYLYDATKSKYASLLSMANYNIFIHSFALIATTIYQCPSKPVFMDLNNGYS